MMNADTPALEEPTMNISKIAMPLLLGALLLPVAANAQGINDRRENQGDRIQQGVRSGELTRREARRLHHREAGITRSERRDRRSGDKFSATERANIQRRLNGESRAIYRDKHNAQYRDDSRADNRRDAKTRDNRRDDKHRDDNR